MQCVPQRVIYLEPVISKGGGFFINREKWELCGAGWPLFLWWQEAHLLVCQSCKILAEFGWKVVMLSVTSRMQFGFSFQAWKALVTVSALACSFFHNPFTAGHRRLCSWFGCRFDVRMTQNCPEGMLQTSQKEDSNGMCSENTLANGGTLLRNLTNPVNCQRRFLGALTKVKCKGWGNQRQRVARHSVGLMNFQNGNVSSVSV